MKPLDRIKEWLGMRRLLKETLPDRRPVPKNLARCVKVGVVYLAVDEKAHLDVRNYVKKLKEDLGLHKIQCIGYFDGKELPFHLHAKLHFDAFCQKDLNWYRIPGGNVVDNFIAEEHDVLLDLTMEDHLPLQYIVAKSRARFKVGRYTEGNKRFLDMMIDTAGARSLPQLIANIDRYLLMINRKVEHSLN